MTSISFASGEPFSPINDQLDTIEVEDNCDIILYEHRTLKCPVCNSKSKSYYCQDCVKHGDFCHSRARLPERFADKKLRSIRLKSQRQDLEERIETQHNIKNTHARLKCEIEKLKERNELIVKVIEMKKNENKKLKEESELITIQNNQIRATKAPFRKRLLQIIDSVVTLQKKCTEKQKELDSSKNELASVVERNLLELRQHIFTIEKVQPSRSLLDNDGHCGDIITAIAEASRTTYVQGRWVYTENFPETQYKIISPLLPGNGNYTAYSRWPYYEDKASCPKNKENQLVSDTHSFALSITAGLMYLQQFIDAIAFYVDVHLPKKVSPRDFWGELNEPEFYKKVARLNYNVMYLCLSQNVPVNELHPHHAVTNLIKLYGRTKSGYSRGDSYLSPHDLQNLSNSDFAALIDCTDSDSDGECDAISSDWEAVDVVSSPVPSNQEDYSYPNSSYIQRGIVPSMSTGYVSSIVSSFVRGFTKPK